MKKVFTLVYSFIVLLLLSSSNYVLGKGKNSNREYYQLIVYHYKDAAQEKVLDNYLQAALIPAMHTMHIDKLGVFKAIANDTAADKTLYVFIPFASLDKIQSTWSKVEKDAAYQSAGSGYISAVFKNPPYTRMETILLYAFPLAPDMQMPQLSSAKKDRVYELRSYESATEKIFANKVKMFNEGGEIDLFKRLNFNAVFYSSVIAGSKMPNLMYMTTFENMADRDAHWKTFVDDAFWKKLSAMPEYQDNVQHADIILLTPAEYSDI